MTSQELAAVRALFAQNLRAFNEALVVDEQRTALTAGDVLGFVEALGCHRAEGTEILALVLCEQAVGVVFNQYEVVSASNLGDCFHLARDTAVVNDANRLSSWCHCALYEAGVNVQSVSSRVDKDWLRTEQSEGARRRNEGARGHDDFIARGEVAEQG